MSVQTNRRLIEAFAAGTHSSALADRLIFCDQAQGCTFSGREATEMLCSFFHGSFNEVEFDAICTVVDETAAVLEGIFHGRHTHRFLGIPPTGRRVALPMVIVCQIADECIYRTTFYYDAGTLLRQVGWALS